MNLSPLTAVSPIDGRYFNKTKCLNKYFSEYAFFYYRLIVEIKWLQSLANNKLLLDIPKFTVSQNKILQDLIIMFDEHEVQQIKKLELQTNHDIKALEYYLKEKLSQHHEFDKHLNFIHFACTSEDINNVAYALMLKDAITNIIKPSLEQVINNIKIMSKKYSNNAMLSHTHGQPATPTTMGKELINFVIRLQNLQLQLTNFTIMAKFNGAVGNYNAHIIAYPEIDWLQHCHDFIDAFGLSFNQYTTQIEPHDGIAEFCHLMTRINNILLDYATDIWTYISLNYFKQHVVNEEIGSSTMPHKVNPIDFENAEGNLGMANAIFNYFANKLTRSRMQRDLSDSTVLRNFGVGLAHTLIAYDSLLAGNNKLELNDFFLQQDLAKNWSVLAEAIQTVMRRYNVPNAYEKMKILTRGQIITQEHLQKFIQTLDIPEIHKTQLYNLMPDQYIGLACKLTQDA